MLTDRSEEDERLQETPDRLPSLSLNTIARFGADVAGVGLGLVAGVITARWLGPAGKGIFSSLTFLSGLFLQVASLGLGDAAIVLVGQRRRSIQEAVSATVGAILVSSVLTAVALWVAGRILFHADWPQVDLAVLTASMGLPVIVVSYVLSHMLNAREQITSSSLALLVTSASTTTLVWLLVVVVPLGVLGGVLAGLLGSLVGLLMVVGFLAREGLSLLPTVNLSYLRPAVRYGAQVQLSFLLLALASRIDLLFVFALSGKDDAGLYSVAVTVASTISYAPWALSVASFPRLARLDDRIAFRLMGRLCRAGVAVALVLGLVVAVLTPAVIPLVFGSQYSPGVLPALILLAGNVLASSQWLISRAFAARGKPLLLLWSYGLSVLTMCSLDVLLIPGLGLAGAALAAVVGPAAGLLFCLIAYCRTHEPHARVRDLIPRVEDFRFLWARGFRHLSMGARWGLGLVRGRGNVP